MNTRAARPQAEMAVTGLDGSAAMKVLAWYFPAAAGRPGHAWPAAGCQYAAALAGRCPAGWLEIADVIVCADRLQDRAAAGWLGATLGRYPGCAVAAVSTGVLECLVGTRAGPPVTFGLGACDGVAEPGWSALLCGSFAHLWLASGRPLGELGPARIRMSASGALAGWPSPVHCDVVPCSLGVAGRSVSGPRESSRCRICPSSGAPTSA